MKDINYKTINLGAHVIVIDWWVSWNILTMTLLPEDYKLMTYCLLLFTMTCEYKSYHLAHIMKLTFRT